MKKVYMFELTLGERKQDPDPVFNILIFRIRPKMVRICNPARQLGEGTGKSFL